MSNENSEKQKDTGFSSRLRALIGKQTESEFAQKCKLPLSTMRKYLAGSVPGLDKAVQIARANNVSVEWLATGEQTNSRDGYQENKRTIEDEFALIPGYSVQVSAGDGRFPLNEQPRRWLAFRKKYLQHRGLREKDLVMVFAKGDSMEPTISDNETILIDTSQKKLNDGHIYVIRNCDELLVKRVQTLWNNGVLLISDNKEYSPQEIPADQMEGLKVIGKVVWVGKDL